MFYLQKKTQQTTRQTQCDRTVRLIRFRLVIEMRFETLCKHSSVILIQKNLSVLRSYELTLQNNLRYISIKISILYLFLILFLLRNLLLLFFFFCRVPRLRALVRNIDFTNGASFFFFLRIPKTYLIRLKMLYSYGRTVLA